MTGGAGRTAADAAPSGGAVGGSVPVGYDAVVLAGGTARRLGGVDKPAERVGGRRLLDRVLDAIAGADRVVAVGPARTTERPVTWTREEPPCCGPGPALAAGLELVRAPLVMVLAADLPFVCSEVVAELLGAVRGADAAGAVLVDAAGAYQWLVGGWRTEALRSGIIDSRDGSLRAVMAPLRPVAVPVRAGHGPPAWYDCDTPEELARARALVGGTR